MVVSAQINVQANIVEHLNQTVAVITARDRAIATSLHDAGVRGDCSVSGVDAATIAFLARCHDTPRKPSYEPTYSERRQVAMAVIQKRTPGDETYYSGWPEYSLQGAHIAGSWWVWVLPGRETVSVIPA